MFLFYPFCLLLDLVISIYIYGFFHCTAFPVSSWLYLLFAHCTWSGCAFLLLDTKGYIRVGCSLLLLLGARRKIMYMQRKNVYHPNVNI